MFEASPRAAAAMDFGRGGWVMIQQNVTEQELEQLEQCLGNLYEDLEAKIKSTGSILELAKRMECLAAVASHGSALCALARVLREEGRKSFALRMNIICVFFVFSFFKNFHQALVAQNVGRATLHVLALEIQITERHQPATHTSKDLTLSTSEQERLLYMSINILLNLAYNTQIEEKMRKFFLIEMLCKALESTSLKLLLVTVTFLKKLSVFKENKETMKEYDIVSKLARLLPCQNEVLLRETLGLLRNLSFDPVLRTAMVDWKMIEDLEPLLNHRKFERQAAALLYNFSTDLNLRPKFVETHVMALLLKILLSDITRSVPEEMTALAINLSAVPLVAETMCEPVVVEKLLERAKHFCDPLLFKVIRNVSQLDEAKSFLLCFVPDLVNLFLECEAGIQVEVMGTLNNMVWYEETAEVLVRRNLLQALSKTVIYLDPDILLEVCMFLGAACSSRTAPTISGTGLVGKMCSVFLETRGDADLIVQFLYMFTRFLLFDQTRKELLLFSEKLAGYVLQLIREPNEAVAKLADILFNVLVEVDQDHGLQLKAMRFAMFTRLARSPG